MQSLSEIPLSLHFKDVALTQGKAIVRSRSDVDISSEVWRGQRLDVPLIAANMSTVTNPEFCRLLRKLGALGVLHRADDPKTTIADIRDMSFDNVDIIAVAIGIRSGQYEYARDAIAAGATCLVIDIAHGYNPWAIELGAKIAREYPFVSIIIGNTVNPDILDEVNDWASAVKVGIASGSACETKNTTGVTEGQFTAVLKFRERADELGMPIISDGGIREPGDFAKAIGAGANSVMAGRIFAMCPESAAPIVNIDGGAKKLYAGMASRYVQQLSHGYVHNEAPEGRITYLDIGEPAEALIRRYAGGLRSAISYAGASDITSFQNKARWVRFV